MNKKRITTITVSMTILTSHNYHAGIKKIKMTAKRVEIGEYVDSDKDVKKSKRDKMFSYDDYQMSITAADTSKRVTRYRDLSDAQKKELKMNQANGN